MEPMSLEGSYADEAGIDQVTWSIADSNRPGWAGRYEITGRIRGVQVSGADFTDLEPDAAFTTLTLNPAGEIDNCELRVQVPATLNGAHSPQGLLALTFHLGAGTYEPVVDAAITAGPTTVRNS